MLTISIAEATVCKMNYDKNCGSCPLRNIEGRCRPNEVVAKEYLKDKSYYLFKNKENEESIYLTNGRIDTKGNYHLFKLGEKKSLIIDELTLINNYSEIHI